MRCAPHVLPAPPYLPSGMVHCCAQPYQFLNKNIQVYARKQLVTETTRVAVMKYVNETRDTWPKGGVQVL